MGKRFRLGVVYLLPFLFALTAGASRALGETGSGHIAEALAWQPLVATIIYGLVGMVLAFVAYKLYDLITPFSLTKELEEDQNVAVGIVVGAVMLGASIIVAAAIIS